MQELRGVEGSAAALGVDLEVLDEIQRRVLWLAVRIVDSANRERASGDGVKVGGHQASSASLVTVMTALWFAYLRDEDRVSVKPHASPVFHAIKYLLGDLDRSYLTRLRDRGGLQSYPSRTKDPDDVDFSPGSVGLGAAAPLFAAAVRRYVDAHFGGAEQGKQGGGAEQGKQGGGAEQGKQGGGAEQGKQGGGAEQGKQGGGAEQGKQGGGAEQGKQGGGAEQGKQGGGAEQGKQGGGAEQGKQGGGAEQGKQGGGAEQGKQGGTRPVARFIALLGDAELDEGNVWEAIADPATQGLGNVMWLVDFNRQSLDRVVPGVRIAQWRGQFEAAGWHVAEVKYGRRLLAAFETEHGDALRTWIDAMPNEHYQSLFGKTGEELRAAFLDGAPAQVSAAIVDVGDDDLAGLLTDLGGHDLPALLDAFAECDAVTDRPSVVFAYTVKGFGLPIAGNPRNHSALLTADQIGELRASQRLTEATEWDRFDPATPAGILCNQRRETLSRNPATRAGSSAPPAERLGVPSSTGVRTSRPVSSQDAFGKILVELSRDPALAPYLVTTAPDVATSTNLAGFINRTGVFHPSEQRSWSADPMLKWAQGPSGQHIELGISEMNLFLLLGQLGLAGELHGQPLLPVGTVYDPFVCRGLDAFIYSAYSGARFVVAGTPSGVTLAPEGGAHQSTITASIGLELPGVTYIEPAYATALDWLLCDAFGRIAAGPAGPATAVPAEDGAYYFRLTTRPLDQAPFEAARSRLGDAVLRRQVLAGAYRLVESSVEGPSVYLAACGAVLPEVLAAAEELAEEGIAAHVVDLTSPDRLYKAWQRTLRQGVRTATTPSQAGVLRAVFPFRAPIVTVHDAASHTLAWLGSALGVPCVPLGVDQFGQSGSVAELYELHDLLPGSVVNAALAALSL